MSDRRARAAAQLLHRPGRRTAEEVVRHLLAVQAQDLRAARLAVRARTPAATAADVDAALEDGTLVVGWLNRGTLHLVARDDYGWLLALTAPGQMTGNARRLAQEGVSPDDAERAVGEIERSLAADGPLTRAQLAERVARRGVRTEGQAMPHLLALAAWRGIAVLIGEQRFAPARGRVDPSDRVDRDAALAELGRRYLAGHAPAEPADLAAWSGLPLRDARAALARARPPAARRARIPPRLLGPFDPYLLGWKDRAFAVAPEHARRIHPGGGIIRATATHDGCVVGTWSRRRGQIEIEPFEALPPDVGAALEAEAAEIGRFEVLIPS